MSLLLSQHVQALLIATASSTDNFLVGLGVALSGKPLPTKVLWGIAICNALGCWLATAGGGIIFSIGDGEGGSTNTAAGSILNYVLAGFAFGLLAFQEYREMKNNSPATASTTQQHQRKEASLQLALPMTLNNLAGGVTGGVLGVPIWINTLYALIVSVGTMYIGYKLGTRCYWWSNSSSNNISSNKRNHHQHHQNDNEDCQQRQTTMTMTWISILLYSLLSMQSFYQALI